MVDLINRSALRPGDIICRRGTATISKAIMLATKSAWSHDAIVVPEHGQPMIGDAIMDVGCQLSTVYDWEQGCRNGDRIIVLRPSICRPEDGQFASEWWRNHVMGHPYDKVALPMLLLKSTVDILPFKVGMESRFYCTEGVRDAWAKGAGINPWWPKLNATPGTTFKRFKEGRFVEVLDSLSEEGRKYRIPI